MIEITRRLLWFDLETTGLNVQEDRIVSLSFTEYKPDGSAREYSRRLDPTVPIPAAVTAIHGIRDEDVVGAPTFAQIAPSLLLGFRDCDYGGYNVKAYDLPLLAAEFARAGHPWSYADAKIIDVMRLWDVLERRSLIRAVERFLGHDHAGAHDAASDIQATIQVFEAMLTQFRGKIPPTVEGIHDLQWPAPEPLILWKNDQPVVNFGKKWKGTPLKLMSRRDLEWIATVATGFSTEVKQICRDAVAGKFPTKEKTE